MNIKLIQNQNNYIANQSNQHPQAPTPKPKSPRPPISDSTCYEQSHGTKKLKNDGEQCRCDFMYIII